MEWVHRPANGCTQCHRCAACQGKEPTAAMAGTAARIGNAAPAHKAPSSCAVMCRTAPPGPPHRALAPCCALRLPTPDHVQRQIDRHAGHDGAQDATAPEVVGAGAQHGGQGRVQQGGDGRALGHQDLGGGHGRQGGQGGGPGTAPAAAGEGGCLSRGGSGGGRGSSRWESMKNERASTVTRARPRVAITGSIQAWFIASVAAPPPPRTSLPHPPPPAPPHGGPPRLRPPAQYGGGGPPRRACRGPRGAPRTLPLLRGATTLAL